MAHDPHPFIDTADAVTKPVIHFDHDDPDLEKKLYAFIGQRLHDLMTGHVPQEDMERYIRKLHAPAFKDVMRRFHRPGTRQVTRHIASNSPLLDFEKRADTFKEKLGWSRAEFCAAAAAYPGFLWVNVNTYLPRWQRFRATAGLSRKEELDLLSRAPQAFLHVHNLQIVFDAPAFFGKDEAGIVLPPEDFLVLVKSFGQLAASKPSSLRSKLKTLAKQFSGSLTALVTKNYHDLPEDAQAWRGIIGAWRKAADLATKDRKTVTYNVKQTSRLVPAFLPSDIYPQIAFKHGSLPGRLPESVASKAVLFAYGADNGFISIGPKESPYLPMQEALHGNPTPLTWNVDNILLRMALAQNFGIGILKRRGFDFADIAEAPISLSPSPRVGVQFFNVPRHELESRFAELRPGIDILEWLRTANTALLDSVDEYAQNHHFALDKEKLTVRLLPTHPEYNTVVKHNEAMRERRTGIVTIPADADVTSASKPQKREGFTPK